VTRDEFEAEYARRSNTTVEELHRFGERGYPCPCGEDGCPGWQMLSRASAEVRCDLGDFGTEWLDDEEEEGER
jgi:hypothetical protein